MSIYIAGHTGKVPYFSQREALQYAKRERHIKGKVKNRKLKVYACNKESEQYGAHYHMTSLATIEYKQLKKNMKRA